MGAAMAAYSGYQGDSTSQDSSKNLAGASALQTQAQNGVASDYTSLQNDVNAGPGQGDISSYEDNSKSLAQMLGQYSQSGGMPGSSDFTQANSLASQAFMGQQTALNQSFQQQMQQGNASAALMGRDGNDPSLQGALRSSQMLQQQQLSANQGSYGNQLAMALPGQRLGYAQQQNNVLGGLATQALANRSSLLSQGNNILGQQQNYQLGASGNTTTQRSGGGISGAFNNLLAVGGMAAKAAGTGGMSMAGGASGGGGASAPQTQWGTQSSGSLSGNNYNQSPSSFFGVSNGSGFSGA